MDNQQLTQEILLMKTEIAVLKKEVEALKEEKELEKINNPIKENFGLLASNEIEWSKKVRQEISNKESIEGMLKKYITTLIEYIEVEVKGKNPVISIGLIENENVDRNAHVGWNKGTIGFHSDDGKLFNEDGNGVRFDEPYKEGDVIGCGYIHQLNCPFYTRNGKLIKVIPMKQEMNYFGIGLREYETVTINSGKTPFMFDLINFNEELTNKTSKYFNTITLSCDLFISVITASIYFSLEEIKQQVCKIIQERVKQSIKQEVQTDFFIYEEKSWNKYFETKDLLYPNFSERILFNSVRLCSLLKDIGSNNQEISVKLVSYPEYMLKKNSSLKVPERVYVKKPVILLYDDTIKEKEEFCCHLELNDAIDIGATYPNPRIIKEDNTKKEYEWKGTYCSDGVSNCVIEINNKHFDYLFWEGVCLKKEEFKGKEVGITYENISNELEVLLKKLGMNEREVNDFIVYWIAKLNKNYYKVTICDSSYDNEIAQLKISGFNQIHRIALKFEEVENINNLPTIDSVEERQRPTGKYVIEWGGIIA
ncbi:hypothetical protein EDI_249480 [Entamoeba dispar SAW760]|uniref:B30.2/SPRY domain-containing protein n=1 Tax=Entamoeba dispar (strain ATCC PRA-260 / SAW760) TaxID=370354 RepID=B0E999_ENTDS|nr:uncharacterized protein EDI_249480 [Entamoeba dispar SAW760]EDR28928.1 hypothetical protein EDI_249480 [Entamoeba dispar SAW760]|eukprot:EDR28928.1 hypothetical protein EDI_249480 [Entamoeba dispar SAW760]